MVTSQVSARDKPTIIPAELRTVFRPLTVREIEVVRYLAKGLLYKEIADRMGISFSIVHKLQHKIFVKLHVGNRTEAINRWSGIDMEQGK